MRRGFTLIELLVVVLILGTLTALASTQFIRVVEKGRVADVLQCTEVMKQAQQRYFMKKGRYIYDDPAPLDVQCAPLTSYNGPALGGDLGAGTFTVIHGRKSPCPAYYGCYYVTYRSSDGKLGCNNNQCVQDLLPDGAVLIP